MRTETNRHFVYRLMEELQKIYLAVVLRRGIDESSLDLLEAMNAISFREFRQLDGDLTDLKQKMSAYISDKASLLQSTVTMAENQRKDDVIVAIKSIMRKVERLT